MSCKHKSGGTLNAQVRRHSECTNLAQSSINFGVNSLKCVGGAAGITARFGEDIFDRLKKEKSIQAHDVTASSGPDSWTLTEEVRSASGSSLHDPGCPQLDWLFPVVNLIPLGKLPADLCVLVQFEHCVDISTIILGSLRSSGERRAQVVEAVSAVLQDMNARTSHDMMKICQAIKNSSVLTIHGGADQTIPFEDAHEFAKHVKHHQLTVINEASHNYHINDHSNQMIQSAVDFMIAV